MSTGRSRSEVPTIAAYSRSEVPTIAALVITVILLSLSWAIS